MILQPACSSIKVHYEAIAKGGPEMAANIRDELRDELLEYAARQGFPIASPSIAFERTPTTDDCEKFTMMLIPHTSTRPNFVGGSNDGIESKLARNDLGVPPPVVRLVGPNKTTETYELQGIETTTMRWTYHLTNTTQEA